MAALESTVYFHGMPGSAYELQLFGQNIAVRIRDLFVPDRSLGEAGPESYFDGLVRDIGVRFPSGPLRLVGFSLGAAAALRVAARMGDRISGIDLISAAAPLELGNYLPDMAGAPIFRLAKASPLLFRLLALGQGAFARFAPDRLHALLFATAAGEDRELVNDPAFKHAMRDNLRAGLWHGRSGYRREVTAYVAGWSAELSGVTAPVRLWHGEADNWSPPAMAYDLAEWLPGPTELFLLPGLSHYSALKAYLELHVARGDAERRSTIATL